MRSHTVHTRHPRYHVSRYDRGKGPFPRDAARIVSPQFAAGRMTLRRIGIEAKMSPELKYAVDEAAKALERGDIGLAAELTSVKSYISDMKFAEMGGPFMEDTNHNENKLNSSVYSLLDSLHHELAMSARRIPSGVVVVTAEGYATSDVPVRRHRTLALIRREHRKILRRIERESKHS